MIDRVKSSEAMAPIAMFAAVSRNREGLEGLEDSRRAADAPRKKTTRGQGDWSCFVDPLVGKSVRIPCRECGRLMFGSICDFVAATR